MTPDERAHIREVWGDYETSATEPILRLLDELERVEGFRVECERQLQEWIARTTLAEGERDTLRAAAFEVIASGHDSETITGLCICTDKGHFEALAAVLLAGSGQVEAE